MIMKKKMKEMTLNILNMLSFKNDENVKTLSSS